LLKNKNKKKFMKKVLFEHKDSIINQVIVTLVLVGIFIAALYVLPKPV